MVIFCKRNIASNCHYQQKIPIGPRNYVSVKYYDDEYERIQKENLQASVQEVEDRDVLQNRKSKKENLLMDLKKIKVVLRNGMLKFLPMLDKNGLDCKAVELRFHQMKPTFEEYYQGYAMKFRKEGTWRWKNFRVNFSEK